MTPREVMIANLHSTGDIVDELLADLTAAGYWIAPNKPTPEMSAAGFCVPEAEHDPAGVYTAMRDTYLKGAP